LEQLGINLAQLISQVVNFTLMAVLLYLLLYKPVLNFMRARQERISRAMTEADIARANAAKAQQEYDHRVAEGQRKAQEIIGQAAQAGEKVAAEIKAEAQREADAIRQKAREEAAEEKGRVLADVQSQMATLSLLAMERVLGQAVDENVQQQLINQSLRALESLQPRRDGAPSPQDAPQ
jgi:F-type H+-transporting ATPase subunit b